MPRRDRFRSERHRPAVITTAAAAAARGVARYVCRPVMEVMEGRTLLSTYTVTNVNDSGAGSFRQAILDANKNAGADTIAFKIGSGAKTIAPKSGLPALTGPTVVDATTQPGFSGRPLIELNGSSAGGGANGIKTTGGNTTIKGFVINRFGGFGVFLYQNGNNKVSGNYIGTDASGAAASGNKQYGVFVQSPNNTIGGTTAADRNVISGNTRAGVFLYAAAAHHNTVSGNYVGTDASGTKKIANLNGVHVNGAQHNTIGGTTAGARNVLSGNTHDGVLINSTGAKYNNVQGNYIGTNAAGTARLGNGWYGVEVSQSYNVVGGTVAGARNVISGSGFAGVVFYLTSGTHNRCEGNFIGTDHTGTKDLGNSGAGVDITNGATNNIVGGSGAAARNVISGNDLFGVGIYNSSKNNTVQGNYIGLCAYGSAMPNARYGVTINNGSAGNLIKGNTIACGATKPVQVSSGATSQAGTNSLYANVAAGLSIL